MNLFCFSLEGSTDSLYEAPHSSPGPTWSHGWDGSEPCITLEFLQIPTTQCVMDLKTAKKSKSASSNLVYCPCTGKRDKLGHHQAEYTSEDPCMMNTLTQEERTGRNGRDDDVQKNNTSLRAMLQRRASNASEKPRNKPKRSYSFGRFDSPKNHSKQEEHESPSKQGADGESPEEEHIKGGLGKKMKAISMTMRKKMGKKYVKALSEETGSVVDGEQEAEQETNADEAPAKECTKSSNSVESLFSLHSGQSSSSSGITNGSEGLCNIDSLRLEEEVPVNIQFCGKAKVHADFIPSPYDTESLKLKVGDMIDIISKSPNGIWTGMLNGKVGNFKFIYVDVLPEERAPVYRMENHRRSRRPRPKTLQEFLERLNLQGEGLQEFVSALLLNGYQTVEDLKDLKEQHLIELNMTDPEHRHKLLAATECLHDVEFNSQKEREGEAAPMSPSETVKAELNNGESSPRDSGCYIASDCSDNSKEDSENQHSVPLSSSQAEV